MNSKVKTRCIFCGKPATVEFFTAVGVVFIHDQCAQDLERMAVNHDNEVDETDEQPASLVNGND